MEWGGGIVGINDARGGDAGEVNIFCARPLNTGVVVSFAIFMTIFLSREDY
jgi:hypothetical protein